MMVNDDPSGEALIDTDEKRIHESYEIPYIHTYNAIHNFHSYLYNISESAIIDFSAKSIDFSSPLPVQSSFTT